MKKYAAHYILLKGGILFKQHVVEINGKNLITAVYPLTNEISGTAFYNGLLLPLSIEKHTQPLFIMEIPEDPFPVNHILERFYLGSIQDIPVHIYQASATDFLSPELCTCYGSGSCYIQRL